MTMKLLNSLFTSLSNCPSSQILMAYFPFVILELDSHIIKVVGRIKFDIFHDYEEVRIRGEAIDGHYVHGDVKEDGDIYK